MATIGIICAMWSEAKPLLSWHASPRVYKARKRTFIEMECWNHHVVVGVSKVGSANATKLFEQLREKYSPTIIINFGSAGAIAPDVAVGTVVVSSATVEYLKKTPERQLRGGAPDLLMLARKLKRVLIGPIVSADQNIDSLSLKQELYEKYDALCGDWESGVLMRLCHQYQIPALAFRVITDFADEQAVDDFRQNHEMALEEGASVLKAFLRQWCVMVG